MGVTGEMADGRVKVVAEGASGRCQDLLALLADGTVGPATAREGKGDDRGGYGGGGYNAGDGGLVWPGRSRRPGRVTRVVHRWAGATGDMSGFLER